nr:hypothetical protein [Lentilactobacillus otakiensis]
MPQSVGIASSSVNAVETTESRDYSILVFRDYRLEIQATTAGRATTEVQRQYPTEFVDPEC